jgi:hypothetical protein
MRGLAATPLILIKGEGGLADKKEFLFLWISA